MSPEGGETADPKGWGICQWSSREAPRRQLSHGDRVSMEGRESVFGQAEAGAVLGRQTDEEPKGAQTSNR